jgi:hypothetical protein
MSSSIGDQDIPLCFHGNQYEPHHHSKVKTFVVLMLLWVLGTGKV